MTAVAGALERVSKLFVESYISESEFAVAKGCMHSRGASGLLNEQCHGGMP